MTAIYINQIYMRDLFVCFPEQKGKEKYFINEDRRKIDCIS